MLKRVDTLNENSKINSEIYYRKIVNRNFDLFSGLEYLKQPYPPRRVSVPILVKFKELIIDLEKKNIMRKTEEPTDWVNSLVVVRKSNGPLRICLDPADLNRVIKMVYFL